MPNSQTNATTPAAGKPDRGGFTIDLMEFEYPPEALRPFIFAWLDVYEKEHAARPGADWRSLLDSNSEKLAKGLSTSISAALAAPIRDAFKKQHAAAYALGAKNAGKHPSRAVQTVERDPATLEILRTVTEYQD